MWPLFTWWSFYASSIPWKEYTWVPVKFSLYNQVFFIYRWSLEQVQLYNILIVILLRRCSLEKIMYWVVCKHFFILYLRLIGPGSVNKLSGVWDGGISDIENEGNTIHILIFFSYIETFLIQYKQ